MAASLSPPRAASLILPLLLLVVFTSAAEATAPLVRRLYESIFGLGDSYVDTGNGPVVVDNPVVRRPTAAPSSAAPPTDFATDASPPTSSVPLPISLGSRSPWPQRAAAAAAAMSSVH
jgi:hypothetical protein